MSVNKSVRKHHPSINPGSGHDLFYKLGPNQFRLHDFSDVITKLHEAKAIAVVVADPLALTLLKPPGEMCADALLRGPQPHVRNEVTMKGVKVVNIQNNAREIRAAMEQ